LATDGGDSFSKDWYGGGSEVPSVGYAGAVVFAETASHRRCLYRECAHYDPSMRIEGSDAAARSDSPLALGEPEAVQRHFEQESLSEVGSQIG